MESVPRQPPRPPPSNRSEVPDNASSEDKVKHWRDRALKAEALLEDREVRLQSQAADILDLHHRAMLAKDRERGMRPHMGIDDSESVLSTRSRSRSRSMSQARQMLGTPRPRSSRSCSVTASRKGAHGRPSQDAPAPVLMDQVVEETAHDIIDATVHEIDVYENTLEPQSPAEIHKLIGMDFDDPAEGIPWASGLTWEDLVEATRRIRDNHVTRFPRKPKKDGWYGPVGLGKPMDQTVMHNLRYWYLPTSGGYIPKVKWDGALENWRKTMIAFANNRLYFLLRDVPMHAPVPLLDSYDGVEVVMVARPQHGREGPVHAGGSRRHTTYTGVPGAPQQEGKTRRRERGCSNTLPGQTYHRA